MRIINLHSTSYRIFIFFLQFLTLLSFIIYLDYIYLTNIRPDMLTRDNFTQTECLLMSKKLSAKGKIIRRYRADFLVNYHANGAHYTRWVSGNGLDKSYFINNSTQELLLSNYENGQNYTCWYDPNNPESVMLMARTSWVSYPLAVCAGLIMLTVLLLFFRNGMLLLGMIKNHRPQEQKN